MEYRPEIDGLRAIAVIPVILFHAGFERFQGGFVGVDVFFVISGYLITTIIIKELRAGSFSLADFYERRARRILPALFFVMMVCVPIAWFVLPPHHLRDFSQSLVATSIFSANVLFWLETGYFETKAAFKPLLHTWSLAVEEQFYLLFPLFLLFLSSFGKKTLITGIVIALLGSLFFAQWASLRAPDAAFFLLPMRAWELAVGCLVAFYLAKGNRTLLPTWVAQAFSLLGLALILGSVIFYGSETHFPGFYALVPTIGTALIILFGSPSTYVGSLLSKRVFVGIGLVSFSAYLWHQPLFAFARHRSLEEPDPWVFVILSLLTVAFAFVSWWVVERPFRVRSFLSRKKVFGIAAAFSALFVTLGLVGHSNGGFPGRFPAFTAEQRDFAKIDNGWCFYSVDRLAELEVGEEGTDCRLGSADDGLRGLLIGDSFAGQYEPFWDVIGKEWDVQINSVTTHWCYPSAYDGTLGRGGSRAAEQCAFNRRYLQERAGEYDFVIFGGAWGTVYEYGVFEDVIRTVRKLSAEGMLVVLMPSPKQFDFHVFDAYMKSVHRHAELRLGEMGQERDKSASLANELLSGLAVAETKVVGLERGDIFLVSGEESDFTSEGVPYNVDGWHISIHGSLYAAKEFLGGAEAQVLREHIEALR